MPRDGSNTFSAPAGTLATPNTPISSTAYNAFVNDLVADANAARPIVAGGTGAATASDARFNLGAAPVPASSAGVGQFRPLVAGTGEALALPAGGSWCFFYVIYNTSGAVIGSDAGRSSGGTVLNAGASTTAFAGFCWRIA